MKAKQKEGKLEIVSAFVRAALKTIQLGRPKDPLSELQLKGLEKKAFTHFRQITDQHQKQVETRDTGEGFLLAAAPRVRGQRGEAWGLAIDENRRGTLVKVTARVGADVRTDATLKVTVPEVKGLVKEGKTYLVTPPSEYLQQILLERFQTIPCLSGLQLYQRDVTVEIRPEGDTLKFLDRGESLLLTVIVAVIKAVTEKTDPRDMVYSAVVDQDGNLKAVGLVKEKVDYVAGLGNRRLVLAAENQRQPGSETAPKTSEHVLWFDSMNDLLDALLDVKVGGEELERGRSVFAPPKAFGLRQVFVGVLAVLVLLGAPIAKSLFYPAHLFMIQYLKATHEALQLRALLKPAGLLIAAVLLVSFGLRYILNRAARGRPSFARITGPILKAMQVVFYTYCGINILFLAGTYYVQPDHFQQYAKIEYLRFNPFFRPLTSSLPDLRLEEFNRLLASDDPSDHAKALDVGIGCRPDDPRFKEVFIGLATLLVDRVYNTEYARTLLTSYMEYERSISERGSANQDIADTVDAARTIVSKYGLKGSPQGGKEFETFLEELVTRYGVDS
jgi:hypothetical protein